MANRPNPALIAQLEASLQQLQAQFPRPEFIVVGKTDDRVIVAPVTPFPSPLGTMSPLYAGWAGIFVQLAPQHGLPDEDQPEFLPDELIRLTFPDGAVIEAKPSLAAAQAHLASLTTP